MVRNPSIPATSDDPKTLVKAVQALKESMEIAQRLRGDPLDSFVRLRELQDLGILRNPGGDAGVVTDPKDHGALTGLLDDDHTQYFNQARGDARYSQLGHAHSAADITSGTLADARLSSNVPLKNTAATITATYQFSGIKMSGTATQTTAPLSSRGLNNAFEWGHSNQAGYASTLGFGSSNGRPFIAFHAEHGTNDNTFRTRGIVGRIISSDAAGGLIIGHTDQANLDNQGITSDLTISAAGVVNVVNSLTVGGTAVSLAGGTGVGTAATLVLSTNQPGITLSQSNAPANNKNWGLLASAQTLYGYVADDGNSTTTNWLRVTRSGNTINELNLSATNITLNGVSSSDFPRLSQKNVFQSSGAGGAQTFSGPADGRIWLKSTSADTNEKYWGIAAESTGNLSIFTGSDAESGVANAIVISRSGTTVTGINMQANVQVTGNVGASGFLTGNQVQATDSLWFMSRQANGNDFAWYSSLGLARLFSSAGGGRDVLTFDVNGVASFLALVKCDAGGEALRLHAGSQDHVYMSFFADTQAPSTRSAYIGFGGVGTTTMDIRNEMTNAVISLGGTIVLSAGSGVRVSGPLQDQSSGAGYLRYGDTFGQGRVFVRNGGSPVGSQEGDITIIW